MNNADLQVIAQDTIEKSKSLFDIVKQISNELLQNAGNCNLQTYYTYLDKLTAIYTSLIESYKKLRALKKNKEAEYYYTLKLQADTENKKFVSAVAEQEASLYVAPLRTARDILEGYVDAVSKLIDTCRTHIYEHIKDKKYEI